MPSARIAQPSCRAVVDAVPDGEIEIVLAVHLKRLIQRAQHRFRRAEIGVQQGAGAEGIGGGDGEQRGADAVAADVQQVDGEVLSVNPVITE